MIEKHGIGIHSTKCLSEQELVKRLMDEYRLSRDEAMKRIEKALRSNEIYRPYWDKNILCLLI